MPRCKYCHGEITKFDSDICPHCGGERPIDEGYRTMDMTQYIDPKTGDYKLYKSKSKKVAILLCLLCGPFGADDFYLGFAKRAITILFATLFFVGGVGSVLFFTGFSGWWIYLALYGAFWLIALVKAIGMKANESLKDARGEFLR